VCFWQWFVARIFGIILSIVRYRDPEVFQTRYVVKRFSFRNAAFEKAQDDDHRPTYYSYLMNMEDFKQDAAIFISLLLFIIPFVSRERWTNVVKFID
jgi:hypothetical protein